jgi:transposase-like protein
VGFAEIVSLFGVAEPRYHRPPITPQLRLAAAGAGASWRLLLACRPGEQSHGRADEAGLGWVRLYEETGNAGVVCRCCGISRPTLRKWWRRYQAEGVAGLEERSRRPRSSPGRKVLEREERLILQLRRERKLGLKRLRIELIRCHGLRLSLDTLHKVLVPPRPEPAATPEAQAQGHQALQPTRPGRPRPARHLQDRARPLPVHRHRRLLPLAGPGPLPG